ncbi:acyl-CoA carboxylase subunit epsilon [Streptomyces reniochalinae]|uniref:Acyl-CoA carboxylase subunit epsilon n=1 Tax=Streptomyces reniochalinae TaxID=2250578 RepID=A0A367F4I0_9ACTN|nr:acyl-CoA carboxylase subunit epsilon [Streptomyces reniochalinae]RCG25266.1 acyl-CoA carboxylase subunit epsilon [Streptomyces reniochalinae]
MSADDPTVRILRGEPDPEELSALLVVLMALAGSTPTVPTDTTAPRPAPWPRPTASPPTAAWRARPQPGWRAGY